MLVDTITYYEYPSTSYFDIPVGEGAAALVARWEGQRPSGGSTLRPEARSAGGRTGGPQAPATWRLTGVRMNAHALLFLSVLFTVFSTKG